MTNEWIDWSDARLRVPLRMTGYPYALSYFVANNNSSSSSSSNNNISTNNTNGSNNLSSANNNNYFSCLTTNKFHFKNRKIQQLYTTNGKLKGNLFKNFCN